MSHRVFIESMDCVRRCEANVQSTKEAFFLKNSQPSLGGKRKKHELSSKQYRIVCEYIYNNVFMY